MSRIIVGMDGSENSQVALRWATTRAERTGDEVVAFFAWSFSDQGHLAPGASMKPEFSDDDAQQLLAKAVEAAGLTRNVQQHTVHGLTPESITEYAQPDDMIVVGARGLGGFKGLLLGSVSQRVLELAPCPVAVIRLDGHAARRSAEIVVGIDGSDVSMRALRWAAAEAAAQPGSSIRIVHAWQWPLFGEVAVPEVYEALEESADSLLAEAAADPSLEGLTVKVEAVNGGAARALLAHDDDAAMLVVADRGRSPVKRLVLGSTSRQVAQHATAPVVVVRPSK